MIEVADAAAAADDADATVSDAAMVAPTEARRLLDMNTSSNLLITPEMTARALKSSPMVSPSEVEASARVIQLDRKRKLIDNGPEMRGSSQRSSGEQDHL
jgi:hypothetical protein